MTDLNDEERRVLEALSELEPATLEEIAFRAELPVPRVKQLLDALAKKGMLDSMDSDESDPNQSI